VTLCCVLLLLLLLHAGQCSMCRAPNTAPEQPRDPGAVPHSRPPHTPRQRTQRATVGGNHEASNYMRELFYGGWAAPNIYFLGYSGQQWAEAQRHAPNHRNANLP
jgi:hypothetical protein